MVSDRMKKARTASPRDGSGRGFRSTGGASTAPMAHVSSRQLWQADHVNPNLANQILWSYRYGTPAACPTNVGDNQPCKILPGARVDP